MSKELTTTGAAMPSIINLFDTNQFANMLNVASFFSQSELVPEMYRVSATVTEQKAQANCMIALSLAQRLQADPLMVMQNLIVIHGRPSWSSKFLIASVNTSGRFEPLRYRAKNNGKIGVLKVPTIVMKPIPGQNGRQKVTEYVDKDFSNVDDLCMVAYTKAIGYDEELVSTEVSIKMAILEGWYEKNGSKWPTMPEKMLKYRAASFWTNEYAPEISMGMKTDDEEMDIIDTDFVEVDSKTNTPSVEKVITEKGNKDDFNFDNAPVVNNEPEAKKEEPAKTAVPLTPEAEEQLKNSKREDPKDEPKKDVLAEQGQAIAAKEAEAEQPKTEANAGVAMGFGKGLFGGEQK